MGTKMKHSVIVVGAAVTLTVVLLLGIALLSHDSNEISNTTKYNFDLSSFSNVSKSHLQPIDTDPLTNSSDYFSFHNYFNLWEFPLVTSFEFEIHSSQFPSSLQLNNRYIVYSPSLDPWLSSQDALIKQVLKATLTTAYFPMHFSSLPSTSLSPPSASTSLPNTTTPPDETAPGATECIIFKHFPTISTKSNATNSKATENYYFSLMWLNGSRIIEDHGIQGLVSILRECEQYIEHSIVISILHPNHATPMENYYTSHRFQAEPLYLELDSQFLAPFSFWRLQNEFDSGLSTTEFQAMSDGTAMQNIHLYRISDKNSMVHKAFEYISSIQYSSQNPEREGKRSISISSGMIIDSGAGSVINTAAIQMSYALHFSTPIEYTADNRQNWAYANSLEYCGNIQNFTCFFLPASNIKLHDFALRDAKKDCHDYDMGLLSNQELKKVGKYPAPIFPFPYSPQNTSSESPCYTFLFSQREQVLRRADRLHRPYPFRLQTKLWWRTVVVDYLTRPNRMVRKYVSSELKAMRFPSNQKIKETQWKCIAVHIRHGDKGSETELHGAKVYMEIIQLFRALYNVNNVFVASDDNDIIHELVNNYKNESINWLWNQHEERWNTDAARLLKAKRVDSFEAISHTLNLITTIRAASKCDYLIDTFTSNIGQLMYTSQLARKYFTRGSYIDSSDWNSPHFSLDMSWYHVTQYIYNSPEWYVDNGGLPDNPEESK